MWKGDKLEICPFRKLLVYGSAVMILMGTRIFATKMKRSWVIKAK